MTKRYFPLLASESPDGRWEKKTTERDFPIEKEAEAIFLRSLIDNWCPLVATGFLLLYGDRSHPHWETETVRQGGGRHIDIAG